MKNNNVMIDPKALAEFFTGEWCACDITSVSELKTFLAEFCRSEIEDDNTVNETDHVWTQSMTDRWWWDNKFRFSFKSEAQAVYHLRWIRQLLRNHPDGRITIADFVRLSGFKTEWWMDHFGWTNLEDAHVTVYRVGPDGCKHWIINLPGPEALRRSDRDYENVRI